MAKAGANLQLINPATSGNKSRAGYSILLLTVLMGMIALAFPVPMVGESGSSLTILVYNYRQVPAGTLAQAEYEAGNVFTKAGLHTVWLNCVLDATIADLCENAREGNVVSLRVFAKPARHYFSDTVSGAAIVPALATVYYDDIPRDPTWDQGSSDVAVLLGCVIAHEIGHLLLGLNSHSAQGIMKGRWDVEQIRLALRGSANFSAAESRLMWAEVQSRQKAWEHHAAQLSVPGEQPRNVSGPGPGTSLAWFNTLENQHVR